MAPQEETPSTETIAIPEIHISEDDPSVKFGKFLANPPPGEEILVTGLAGQYPDSEDVNHFKDNLFNKVDLVSDDERRWEPGHPEIPQRTGKLLHIERFDAGFFGIHWRQATSMDPVIRMLLERVIEAMFDAGVNPSEWENTNTGVYVGACFSESEKVWFYDKLCEQGYGITGCERSMIANRVSYFFKFKGPSIVCDTACSSSLYALEQAYKDIRMGLVDQAVVAGTNLCLHPFVSLQFARLGVLSMDGRCKAFDQEGNGYVRSEAVSAILLQKSKDARRNYCKIVHAKTNCDGYKDSGITYPSGEMQMRLLKEFYTECKVKASELTFLEAHGTGTKVGDPEECMSIDEVYTSERTKPLLMGSVKSNIGHTEPTSGLCSLTKAIIAYETGYIAPNLNYTKPRQGMTGLESGRLVMVTEKTPLPDKRGLIGVNNFGFGGGNCHALFEWNHKEKIKSGKPKDDLPRLVCVSGRNIEAVETLLDDVSVDLDYEHVRLLHDVFKRGVKTHLYRGYTIVSKVKELCRSSVRCGRETPHFSVGFGELSKSQINNCKSLLELPVFESMISRVSEILAPKGVKLKENFYKDNLSLQEHILMNLAVQLGIVDILKELEVKVDQFVGSSVGDIISLYANGALSLKDTVECGYVIGIMTSEVAEPKKFDNKLQKNASDTLYYNGDTGDEFGIFSKNAFNGAKNKLIDKLTEALMNGKRPTKQKSTTIEQIAKSLSSTETLKNIFKNVKQDRVFLSVGRLAVPDKCKCINLDTQLNGFLGTLGSLYETGVDLVLHKIYPKVELPVSRGTRMLSHKIKWNHKRSWWVTKYRCEDQLNIGEKQVGLVLRDPNYTFIQGHIIDGRTLLPATGYLQLVWDTLAQISGLMTTDTKVVFENCKFLRACTIPLDTHKLELTIMIQRGSGNYEIIESDSPVASGRVSFCENILEEQIDLSGNYGESLPNELPLKTKDIYKELRLRGYNYRGMFRGIDSYQISKGAGKIKWEGNWIAFIDNMLQTSILQEDSRLLYVPTTIQKVLIDAKKHIQYAGEFGENPLLPVTTSKNSGIIRSGYIELRGVVASSIARRKYLGTPVLEKYVFIPNDAKLTKEQSVRVNAQMILENTPTFKVKVVELIDEATKQGSEPLAPIVYDSLGDLPLIQTDITVLSKEALELRNIKVEDKKLLTETDCTLIIATDLLQRVQVLQVAFGSVKKDSGYLISREDIDFDTSNLLGVDVITVHTTENEKLILFRKSLEYKTPEVHKISLENRDFTWLPNLQESLKNSESSILLYSQNEPLSGLLGLTNCLRREPSGKNVKCVFIADSAPNFNLSDPFYKEQLKKNLFVNVFKSGQWGTFRHLLLEQASEIEADHAYAHSTVRGDLSSLKWIQGSLSNDTVLSPEQELVQVYVASLNFKDVMTASGRINVDAISRDRLDQECLIGLEFAGKTPSGKRVMGMVGKGALSTLVAADQYLLWEIPEKLSLEDAATVPVVYCTCMYALMLRGNCKRGDTILIHSGTGGIGLAAITLSLHLGCRVYTTVGTPEKREYLKQTFPQLSDKNIFYSRDVSFEKDIMRATNGRGVDIVLNSLVEEKLLASVRCLAHGGRFLEIGKYDIVSDNRLNTMLFQKEASFHGVMVDTFFARPPADKKHVADMLTELINAGGIVPLKKNVFKINEIEDAFRFMTTGKHMGKVIVQVRNENDPQSAVEKIKMKCLPKFYCNATKSYIICGGLGGFGLELADWLVLRGAKKLILTSRTGIKTGYQDYRIRTWKSYGCQIKISTADITTMEGCRSLLQEANSMAPIKAIFNLAVVLKDAVLENQTEETFHISFAPKAFATEYLDILSRELCPELSYFVVFSSVSCGRGNPGQTNYGMANSVMERICEKRRSEGLPATAIEWGAVGDVGLVAEMQEEHNELAIGGTLQQRISNCLQVIDMLLTQNEAAVVSSMVVAEKKGGSGGADNIVDAVANILGIKDIRTISMHATLAEVGMDSMTAVEIKQTLEREFGVYLSAQDIKTMTFARLQEIQAELDSQNEKGGKKERALVGLDMIIRVIGEQSLANIPAINMRSKPTEREDLKKIILIPGIEGCAKVLEPLAVNLEGDLTCVQFCSSSQHETMEDIAEFCLPTVEEKFSKDEEFNIIGYSFGAIVALELVKLLEEKGYKGNLMVIDGAPAYFQGMAKGMEVEKEDSLQTKIMMHLLGLQVTQDKIMPHIESIFKCNSLDERINLGISIVGDASPYSKEYQREICINSYKRIKAIMAYSGSLKLKTPVKLFKPQLTSIDIESENYLLSDYCELPVQTKVFSGNHASVLENPDLADLINALNNGVSLEEWEKEKEEERARLEKERLEREKEKAEKEKAESEKESKNDKEESNVKNEGSNEAT